jgi:hypothetical protein
VSKRKKTPEEYKADRDFRALIGGIVGMTAGDYAGAGALSALKGGKPIHWVPRIAAGMVGGTIGSGVGSAIGAKTASCALSAIVKTAEGPDALDRLSTAGKRSFEGGGAGAAVGGLIGGIATRNVSGALAGAGIGGAVGGAAGLAHGATVPTSRKQKAVERTARIKKFLKDKEKRAAKKDAPNYRKASSPAKSCGTCVMFKPKGDGTGRCKAFDFTCHESMTCDAWTGKGKEKKAGAGAAKAAVKGLALVGVGLGAGLGIKPKKKQKRRDPYARYRIKHAGVPFLEQKRPAKVKEIYRALERDHPEYSAEKKARIASSKGAEKKASAKSDAAGGFFSRFSKKAPTDEAVLSASKKKARYGDSSVYGKPGGPAAPAVQLERMKMKMRAAKQGSTPPTPSSISGV